MCVNIDMYRPFLLNNYFLLLDLGKRGGEVGLAITQAAALTGLVQWGMRQSAEVANQLMSVERVLDYKHLPQEKQPDIPKIPPKAWPDKGRIVFNQMGLKYVEAGTLVLKNLNLVIQPNEKVYMNPKRNYH